MKYCVATMLLVLLSVSLTEARTWKSSSGKFTIEAELVGVKDGNVLLRKEDGATITVPLDKLSEADQKFIAAEQGESTGWSAAEKKPADEKASSAEEMRTWSSRGGNFTIEARFVEFKNGKAELLKSDGEKIAVSLAKLSDEDGRYVRELLAERRKESAGTTTASRATGSSNLVLGDEAQTVQLKPLLIDMPQPGATGQSDAISQYLMRTVRPQSFYHRSVKGSSATSSSLVAFKKRITKEPKYEAEEPFRGVARLGSQEFGFALDAVDSKTPGLGRLLFDINGNGDLTDDKPVEGISRSAPNESYSQYQFPRVELNVDVDGKPIEYAFLLSVYSRKTDSYSYVSASLLPAAYREGALGSGRNQVRVILVDSNSNGRFDDLCTVREVGGTGQAYPSYGDSLLVNPNPAEAIRSGGLDANRFYLSKLMAVGDRFYDVAVTPTGDTLTLAPSKAPIGYVTNSSTNFSAMLYSQELGVLKIVGDSKTRVPMPVGQWRLASYTIDAASEGGEPRGGSNSVSAAATKDTPPVTIAAGETTPMEFGAPYRPVVTSSGNASSGKVYLSLAIIGAAGERCTGIRVGGSRPPAPEFEIVDSGGKVVEQGKFAYG